MQIVAMKLVSGEEIIGKFKEPVIVSPGTGPSDIVLYDVRMLIMVPTQQGIGIAIQPWLTTVDINAEITIKERHIMIPVWEVPKEIETAYLKAVSSIEIVTR